MAVENMFGKHSFLKRASRSIAKTGFENSVPVDIKPSAAENKGTRFQDLSQVLSEAPFEMSLGFIK